MNYYEKQDKIIKQIKEGEFQKVPYGTTGTYAYFDVEEEKYYNDSGQELRSPEEYHADFDSAFENQDYD